MTGITRPEQPAVILLGSRGQATLDELIEHRSGDRSVISSGRVIAVRHTPSPNLGNSIAAASGPACIARFRETPICTPSMSISIEANAKSFCARCQGWAGGSNPLARSRFVNSITPPQPLPWGS
jgi:hypothetical protein